MEISSLLLGVVVGLAIALLLLGLVRLLRGGVRRGGAHTEPRSSLSDPAVVEPMRVEAPAPLVPQRADPVAAAATTPADRAADIAGPLPGPVEVLITYTKQDGTTRNRHLTILSRHCSQGQTESLKGRMQGERLPKTFLLRGISLLAHPAQSPTLQLSDPDAIRSWLEAHIPEAEARDSRRTRTSPASARTAAPPVDASANPSSPASAQRQELATEILPAQPEEPTLPPEREPVGEKAAVLTLEALPLEALPLEALPLEALLPEGAKGFAVFDLETTGVTRTSRIVEIAVVCLDHQGRVTGEWETVVQPGVAISNGHVHRLHDDMLLAAPMFAEIAGPLATRLDGHVLVAHNLNAFDLPVLEAHFAEVEGLELSLGVGLDTLRGAKKMNLAELCEKHGVSLDPTIAHTAMGDAMALSRALQNGMAHLQPAQSTVVIHCNPWNDRASRPLTRRIAAGASPPAGWQASSLPLEAGQNFISTGPQCMLKNTEINFAIAHGTGLGLSYCDLRKIPVSTLPDFLLSTSLSLQTTKMLQARERGVPVVLCRDFVAAAIGDTVRMWTFTPGPEPQQDPG